MSTKQPTSLVKFADADSAIRILSDSTLRWSAPCLFADPFELNHHSMLNFDSRTLLTSCVKNTLGLIFSRDDPKGVSPLIKAIRRWRTEDRFDSEEEATEVLTELLTSMVQHREPEMLAIMREWKDYSKDLRILCLSESHENIDAWQHYASRHTGVAIRFSCGEDTTMEHPQPVRYSESKPEISSLAEQMDILMNQNEINVQENFSEKFLIKSKTNIKEKEWRLLKHADDNSSSDDESSWFEDVPFHTSELRSIYFGARLSDAHRQEINAILNRKFSSSRIFQATVQHNKFELDFERLNGQ